MPLLAEEIVEEWLNRQGFFTIRGIKLGNDEIDLIALKKAPSGYECRHIEVAVSINPISYISKLPRATQKATGRNPNTAKRSPEELRQGVKEFVQKKFRDKRKAELLRKLFPNEWSTELVVHNVKSSEELDLIAEEGIRVLRLTAVLEQINQRDNIVQAATGTDFISLINIKKNL